ncbi:MAG: PAS domain-containing protein [Phycisphaerales bacterium]
MALEKQQEENAELRRRLEEAEETLHAIQSGAVDALVVQEASGHRVYTLEGADRPYRLMVEQMQQGAATLYLDGSIAYCNVRLAEMLVCPHEKVVGATLRDFIVEADYPTYDALLEQGKKSSGRGEARLKCCNGETIPVLLTFNTLPEDCGVAIGVLVTDLTAQRHHEQLAKAQKSLREHSVLFDRVLSSITDFVYFFDLHGRFTFVNRPLLDLWGMSLEEAVGKTFFELPYPHELAKKLHKQIQQVIETGQGVVDETPYTSPTGTPGFYQYIFTPVFGADGKVEAVAGSTRDFSTIKRLEAEREHSVRTLRVERSNLAAMVESAPSFICLLSGPEHVFELANGRYYELVRRGNLIGKTVREALPEVVGQGFVDLLDQVYQTGRPFEGTEMPVWLQSGTGGTFERRFVNFVFQALRGPENEITGVFVHGIDVTNEVQTREALREGQERLRLGLEAGNTGTWDWNILDNSVVWSDRVYEFHGLNELTFSGKVEDFQKMVHPEDAKRVGDAIQASIERHTPYQAEFRVVRPTGEVRWLTTSGKTYYDSNGSPLRMLGATSDITERKRAEIEREMLLSSERFARGEAERAGRLKDEFLATLSHELRTPLNAVLGWAQILRNKPPTAEVLRQGLAVIERNARMQAQLVTDLLDMSRIISGKMRLDVQRVELPVVIDAAIESIRPAAEAKEVRIHSVLEPDSEGAYGDPARLQQVVWNLVSNAVKFTPKGGRVQVVLSRVNSHFELAVSDSGKGIDAAFLPHVFERFRQGDSSAARDQGGLGLGLAIVKQLVELHGGSVHVASEGKDKGSTFTVRLPLAAIQSEIETSRPQHPRTISLSPARSESPDLRGVAVLVVDDEPDARDLIRRVLEECGAAVSTAASADEAIGIAMGKRVDVILSDIGLPERDGYEFMRSLRAQGCLVPAAALTAFARTEDRTRALQAGYLTHISKPVETAELLATVASLAMRDTPKAAGGKRGAT